MGNDKCFDLLMKKNDECVVLREALEKIEQRANERHSGEHERDVVYAMFYIAQAALRQPEPQENTETVKRKYMELVMAVSKKFPFESRHQTALRYIMERENQCSDSKQAMKQTEGGGK
jgi:hypothetical protein